MSTRQGRSSYEGRGLKWRYREAYIQVGSRSSYEGRGLKYVEGENCATLYTGRSSYEGRGLKYKYLEERKSRLRRSSYEGRGLKFVVIWRTLRPQGVAPRMRGVD